jgi:hypothetical protein
MWASDLYLDVGVGKLRVGHSLFSRVMDSSGISVSMRNGGWTTAYDVVAGNDSPPGYKRGIIPATATKIGPDGKQHGVAFARVAPKGSRASCAVAYVTGNHGEWAAPSRLSGCPAASFRG